MAVLTDRGRKTRAREVENAIARGRLEGLEPSAGAQKIFQRYVDGELTPKSSFQHADNSGLAATLETKIDPFTAEA